MQLSEIEDVVNTQKNTLKNSSLGLNRDELKKLPDLKNHVLIISGVRRCGKSTLLCQFATKLNTPYFYLNFDDLRLANFKVADYKLLDSLISASGVKMLFFDEVQMAPRWEAYVRQKLDQCYKIIVSGSNASLLSRELGTKLTGRHITIELFPFSYNEFLRFKKRKAGVKSLELYFEKGGFPEYLKTDEIEILAQLQQDILYRDIAVRYGLRDVSSLKRLFVYVVSNSARLISPSRLTAVAGVKSHTTVLEYLSYFEQAYLISLVPCFAWSVKKQNIAPKKVYVNDFGFIHSTALSFSKDTGCLLETFVFNHLRIKKHEIYYFANKDCECDFVVSPYDSDVLCVQVCAELNHQNREREINGLIAALDFFNSSNGIIITKNFADVLVIGDRQIEIVSAWEWACRVV